MERHLTSYNTCHRPVLNLAHSIKLYVWLLISVSSTSRNKFIRIIIAILARYIITWLGSAHLRSPRPPQSFYRGFAEIISNQRTILEVWHRLYLKDVKAKANDWPGLALVYYHDALLQDVKIQTKYFQYPYSRFSLKTI